MFHPIPAAIRERMQYLEEVDARDRNDGTPKSGRLRQIPPETGRFLALLAASAPPGQVLEVGTSGGYSSLWLALACQARGDRLVTFEASEEKARLAGETFRLAGVESIVQLVHAEAGERLPEDRKVAFCFLDVEKDFYRPCYEMVIPNLAAGGIFTADNAISHAGELQAFLDYAHNDPRVDALVVPIGKGVLVCRRP